MMFFLIASIWLEARAAADSKSAVRERVHNFIVRGFNADRPQSVADLLAKLGRPLRSEERMVRNVHSMKRTDKIVTLFYEGLTVKVYQALASKREFVIAIQVTSPKYRMQHGLAVGDSRDQILGTLGYAPGPAANLLIYDDAEAGTGRVYFFLKGDTVRAIRWEYYFD